jgi:hypothetical protein
MNEAGKKNSIFPPTNNESAFTIIEKYKSQVSLRQTMQEEMFRYPLIARNHIKIWSISTITFWYETVLNSILIA